MNVSIPAFPSQDLAKLVLGYLAEEQLMTAYDEFLQASPYLDAHSNEYDRIFMTSLKNVLAEYRAVKICVETCKPISLRKKIFQCANLLEIVKFLIQNTDISKIGVQETTTNKSITKNVLSKPTRTTTCDICNSLRLTNCVCIKNNALDSNQNPNPTKNCVDTTPLSDLPGSHVNQKRQISKFSETDTASSSFHANTDCSSYSSKLNLVETNTASSDTSPTVQPVPAQSNLHHESSTIPDEYLANSLHTTPESLKLEEFNKILNLVSTHNESVNKKNFSHNLGLSEVNKKVSGAENFQVFSSGITGGDTGNTVIVPDSSTSEHCAMQEPANMEPNLIDQRQSVSQCGTKRVIKRQYLLKVATVDNNTICKVNNEFVNSGPHIISLSQHKADDPKITILSDVKVDNAMPPVLKSNASSTPLMQMQTVMINGTPVYRHVPQVAAPSTNYTKDEIMAMPTIILMPASAPPGVITSTQTTTIASRVKGPTHSVEPLVIDISPDNRSNRLYDYQTENPNDDIAGLVGSKTLDAQNEVKNSKMTQSAELTVKNATAPKDETGISKTSTPHVLPPKRKSSSTPRRSSHIRVLDFTTPRRILHEAINERPLLEEEVILSRSPNLVTSNAVSNAEFTSNNMEKVVNTNAELSLKENCITPNDKIKKKRNWDADLRALAIASPLDRDKVNEAKPQTKRKNKSKLKNSNEVENKTRKVKKPTKKSKNKFFDNELIVIDDNPTDIDVDVAKVNKTTPNAEKPIKPTINILPGNDWGSTSAPDSDKSQNKSANNDTPEIDRLSLHNAIDSKLNISELLETPYKQALYDIQMGTPRFFGPDLPDGEPMSDIKIMNIPTPRFLNTPKPVQATPGSYSSRPTDYSSGGSYYKPDDLEFVPTIECQIIPTKSDSEKTDAKVSRRGKDSDTEKQTKSCRPTRKCAKNVSYYNLSMGKTKENDDKSSTCSDTVSINSSFDNSKENKPYNKRKSSVKTYINVSKTHKTPVKKETPKTVVKSKSKVSLMKNLTTLKSKTPESSRRANSKPPARKKTNTKVKQVTPISVPVPTKSRRKSSTPRKLHCTKQFNSPTLEQDTTNNKPVSNKKNNSLVSDSDVEQTPLRWSDDCSHDSTAKHQTAESIDTDDISKIKEFIETTVTSKSDLDEPKSSTQVHLIKRGFDAETAKIIERDLLDLPPDPKADEYVVIQPVNVVGEKIVLPSPKSDINIISTTAEIIMETESNIAVGTSDTVDGKLEENYDDGDDSDEIELSIHECNEDTNNYMTYNFDDNKDFHEKELPKLKDKYSMEVCIDEHVSIRLRATPFSVTLDQDMQEVERYDYSYKETEMAVNSISNIERLYTPLKDSIRAQCYEIFDSTLTSIDTPLKCADQHENESTVTDIVLEVENLDEPKQDTRKRKIQTDRITIESKKPRTENIELDFDIETVLSKLHGPKSHISGN